MFSRLSLDIRLIIWEAVLEQPRVVYIKMRELPGQSPPFYDYDNPPKFASICSTPVPALLHLCSETRALALKHYELAFSRATPPVHNHMRNIGGDHPETVTECDEANITKYEPKVYLNFKRDTVIFSRNLWPYRAPFPDGIYFNPQQLQNIENLGLSIGAYSDGYSNKYSHEGSGVFWLLNRHIKSGGFQALKKLYICLEADNLDLSKGVELVDLKKTLKEGSRGNMVAERFAERWNSSFENQGAFERHSDTSIGDQLKRIYTYGIRGPYGYHLKDLLLKKRIGQDELLSCVWVGGIGEGTESTYLFSI